MRINKALKLLKKGKKIYLGNSVYYIKDEKIWNTSKDNLPNGACGCIKSLNLTYEQINSKEWGVLDELRTY